MENYTTQEQFEDIADNCNNGNWSDAAKDCIGYSFYAHDLIRFEEELGLFSDGYKDIAILAELAQKLRG